MADWSKDSDYMDMSKYVSVSLFFVLTGLLSYQFNRILNFIIIIIIIIIIIRLKHIVSKAKFQNDFILLFTG